VLYVRGASAIAVQATFGKKLLRLDDGTGGYRLEWTDMDFLIPARSMAISGTPITPMRGDVVKVSVGGLYQKFEVRPYATESAWRWSDPGQTMLRIHAKFIGTEPAP
jgi:hypothetical protein